MQKRCLLTNSRRSGNVSTKCRNNAGCSSHAISLAHSTHQSKALNLPV